MENDFERHLERKAPFYVFCVSLLSHTLFLKKYTDTCFVSSFFTYGGNTGFLYHSKSEYEKVEDDFSKMIVNNSENLKIWHERAKSLNSEADKRLQQENTYPETKDFFIDLFVHSTVIPYFVLSAIESKKLQKTHKKVLENFEELRGQSKYPIFTKEVLPQFFDQANEKLGTQLATFLTPDELGDVLRGKDFPVDFLQNRKELSFVQVESDKLVIKSEKPKWLKEEEISKEVDEILGNVAQKGKASGKVRIVNITDDMDGFEEGNILVSINTNPSLMPAIRKAGAVVTDEGGIMCHAAIVSRELGKPCIIGTKIATKVLKDGDEVEVDAERGIVTILNKA